MYLRGHPPQRRGWKAYAVAMTTEADVHDFLREARKLA
jgi:hypothetical protein